MYNLEINKRSIPSQADQSTGLNSIEFEEGLFSNLSKNGIQTLKDNIEAYNRERVNIPITEEDYLQLLTYLDNINYCIKMEYRANKNLYKTLKILSDQLKREYKPLATSAHLAIYYDKDGSLDEFWDYNTFLSPLSSTPYYPSPAILSPNQSPASPITETKLAISLYGYYKFHNLNMKYADEKIKKYLIAKRRKNFIALLPKDISDKIEFKFHDHLLFFFPKDSENFKNNIGFSEKFIKSLKISTNLFVATINSIGKINSATSPLFFSVYDLEKIKDQVNLIIRISAEIDRNFFLIEKKIDKAKPNLIISFLSNQSQLLLEWKEKTLEPLRDHMIDAQLKYYNALAAELIIFIEQAYPMDYQDLSGKFAHLEDIIDSLIAIKTSIRINIDNNKASDMHDAFDAMLNNTHESLKNSVSKKTLSSLTKENQPNWLAQIGLDIISLEKIAQHRSTVRAKLQALKEIKILIEYKDDSFDMEKFKGLLHSIFSNEQHIKYLLNSFAIMLFQQENISSLHLAFEFGKFYCPDNANKTLTREELTLQNNLNKIRNMDGSQTSILFTRALNYITLLLPQNISHFSIQQTERLDNLLQYVFSSLQDCIKSGTSSQRQLLFNAEFRQLLMHDLKALPDTINRNNWLSFLDKLEVIIAKLKQTFDEDELNKTLDLIYTDEDDKRAFLNAFSDFIQLKYNLDEPHPALEFVKKIKDKDINDTYSTSLKNLTAFSLSKTENQSPTVPSETPLDTTVKPKYDKK